MEGDIVERAGGSEDVTTVAYLALGANLGDRVAHLRHALRRLAEEGGRLTGVSRVYETDPVGFEDQPPFLNLVARLETPLEPEALLDFARRIEGERGRERTFRNAPRTLDIDVLLYGDRRIDRPGLTVPHPRMNERAFVLVPLLELEPALREPGTGRAYADWLEEPTPGIRPVRDGAELLAEGDG